MSQKDRIREVLNKMSHRMCVYCNDPAHKEFSQEDIVADKEIIDQATNEIMALFEPDKEVEHQCKHCGGDIRIRNPKGYCDHLYYPENCQVCQNGLGKRGGE